MTDQTEQNQTEQTELTAEQKAERLKMLKARADLMGVTYSNNISYETLKERIDAKLNGDEASTIQASNEALESGVKTLALGEDLSQLSPTEKLRREQMALVRCRITNLDPKKKDLPGEIFTVANRVLGTVRKFVPYGELTENGYHIPRILFNELASRRFNHITSSRDPRTKTPVISSKWVKEFSLEVLEPLTQEELNRLATAQIAAGTVGPIGELA
jgi:hypothetical protein